MKYYQIAIDGPAGSGKSSIAKLLARKLGFTFINSGGFYRAVTVAIVENKIPFHDVKKIIKLIDKISVTQIGDDMYLNGRKVTDQCYSAEITTNVPTISKIKEVREFCLNSKVLLSEKNNIVIEGRDTTTVLFPNATLKCWLFASPKIRAKRRWEQMGKISTLKYVLQDMLARDKADTERAISPMVKAHDAFELDTSDIPLKECVDILLREFNKRRK